MRDALNASTSKKPHAVGATDEHSKKPIFIGFRVCREYPATFFADMSLRYDILPARASRA
jgi:hypothetical protein